MKKLYKAINMGIVSLPLLLGGCKIQEQQYMKLQGTVINETYTPTILGESILSPNLYSQYSFSMNTKNGKKAVQVKSTQNISIETINSLVDSNSVIEIEIKKEDANKQVYTVAADKIKALDK